MYTYVINPIFLYFSVNILFWQTTKNGEDLNPFMPVVLYLGGIFLTNPSFKYWENYYSEMNLENSFKYFIYLIIKGINRIFMGSFSTIDMNGLKLIAFIS